MKKANTCPVLQQDMNRYKTPPFPSIKCSTFNLNELWTFDMSWMNLMGMDSLQIKTYHFGVCQNDRQSKSADNKSHCDEDWNLLAVWSTLEWVRRHNAPRHKRRNKREYVEQYNYQRPPIAKLFGWRYWALALV